MKKVLSLALTLCMLVSMFSFSSFAGDDSSASVSATPQITATNSVGSIVKESLESATEEETTGDYVISKLSVEDGKIVCRVAALESSTLIVAFYDENTDQMLTSTNCTVTNTQRDYSLNLPNGLPEYYKHEFTEEIIKEPTCAQNGEKKLTCQCGKVEIVAIPALGHKEETIKGTPATCTKDGLTDGTKCSVCGEIVKAQEVIKATGNHTYSAWQVTKEATCTATGTQTRTCSVCGKTETQTIAKTAHKVVTDKAVAATCTKNGKTAGSHCSVCGTVLKAQTTVKAKGHNYGKWTVTKQPTYTATGIQTRTCTACGAKQTATVAKRATTSIAKCTVSTSKYAVYTGKALAPKVTVKNGKITLKAGAHYTVAYKNNTKIGKATVTIKGIEKNGYSGSKTLTFNILPGVTKSLKTAQSTSAIKLAWSKVAGATGYRVYRHDGKKWIKLADTKNTTYTVSKLKAGTSYKYAVRAYTIVGKTVYWGASYSQILTATKPATPTLKAKAGTKQAALSWNKIAGATGYEVWMAAGKNGSYKKLTTIKKNATIKYTAMNLKKGGMYYFKVRAYKMVDGRNVYGAYSKTIGVKAK